ncbi:hypothetical protein Pcinc_006855 [Petrolisthes cinctipes]|uniref:Uncharacterized protein n=1 Tax=Petrolisthes cinctipes TaxID=88211 RepID=A0AAE1GGF2_PETCI|nr:hypothetical protein Pcinc_006855 [Petrolisthes cinctipes]
MVYKVGPPIWLRAFKLWRRYNDVQQNWYLPYEERCQRLGLQTLSDRRKRGDMIQTYKLLHGFDDVHTLYQILQAEHKQSQGTLTEAGKTQSLENETERQLV